MASRTEVDAGRVTLYCLGHAGAGVASYRRWPTGVGPAVDVVTLPLPGRESRRREPRVTDRAALLADLMPTLLESAEAGQPYAIYGHSLGALVAYTLTRALADAGVPDPLFLAVAACLPPHVATALVGAADLPDEHLLPLLDRLGSLPKGDMVRPGGLWHRTVLPVLRDDLRLARSLREAALDPVTGGPVDAPVLVFAGSEDPLAVPALLDEWRGWATGSVEVRTVDGGHFFAGSPDLPGLVGQACRDRVAALAMGGRW